MIFRVLRSAKASPRDLQVRARETLKPTRRAPEATLASELGNTGRLSKELSEFPPVEPSE